jgi:hypothetical protein
LGEAISVPDVLVHYRITGQNASSKIEQLSYVDKLKKRWVRFIEGWLYPQEVRLAVLKKNMGFLNIYRLMSADIYLAQEKGLTVSEGLKTIHDKMQWKIACLALVCDRLAQRKGAYFWRAFRVGYPCKRKKLIKLLKYDCFDNLRLFRVGFRRRATKE